jgi:hypothetical protein
MCRKGSKWRFSQDATKRHACEKQRARAHHRTQWTRPHKSQVSAATNEGNSTVSPDDAGPRETHCVVERTRAHGDAPSF